MGKIRVHELAKELNMDSKSMVVKLIEIGYDVKSHSSALEEATANEIRTKFGCLKTKVEEKRLQGTGKSVIIRRRTTQIKAEEPILAPIEEPVAPIIVETEEPHPTLPVVVEEKKQQPVPDVAIVVEQATPQPEPIEEKTEEPIVPITEAPEIPVSHEKEEVEHPSPSVVHEVLETSAPEVEVAISVEVEPPKTEAQPETPTPIPIPAEDVIPTKESEERQQQAELRKISQDRPKKGLARIIKKAAIYIPPPEEEKSRFKRVERPPRPATRPGTSAAPGPRPNQPSSPPSPVTPPAADDAAKGKKGKRFVKFDEPTEQERLARKGGVRRRDSDVFEVEELDEFGGRIGHGIRVGRSGRGGPKKPRKSLQVEVAQPTRAVKKRIKVTEFISVGDLAHRMGAKAGELIAKLMSLGTLATVNQKLDVETASLIADEFGFEIEKCLTEEDSITTLQEKEEGGEQLPRPPVVTVMGHVDHGKTSILDAIRKTDVASTEAGGITQHIGAHYVRSVQGDVVFLDTPGHAAFTEMRSRGAKVTDVVVLVVAADDGVMEQTKEAINHAKAAGVPIVVAVNKMDKPDADPMRVMRELSEFALVPEEWGGETIYCQTSAKKGEGIEQLLEHILLQAEVLDLKADPNRKARGIVIEAQLHKGRGPIATVLVQQGTLKAGDHFVVGQYSGKVRNLFNDKGQKVDEAGPSVPVEIQGLEGVPQAGDELMVVPDEKMAKSVAADRQMRSREKELAVTSKVSLDNLFLKLQEGEVKELCVVLRADVQGTLEAFRSAIEKLSTSEVRVRILHDGTGTITDSDVLLAAASEAIIIGFNVRPSGKVAEFAKSENVDIRFYDVIYHAIEDISKALAGMLAPKFQERVIGTVEVRQTFSVPKIGTIAGSYVTSGKIERNAGIRLLREGVVVYTGKISSLKRFKDDVREVLTGYECGVGLENFNDIRLGDIFEAFVMDKIEPQL